jgi:hypothetical protein
VFLFGRVRFFISVFKEKRRKTNGKELYLRGMQIQGLPQLQGRLLRKQAAL